MCQLATSLIDNNSDTDIETFNHRNVGLRDVSTSPRFHKGEQEAILTGLSELTAKVFMWTLREQAPKNFHSFVCAYISNIHMKFTSNVRLLLFNLNVHDKDMGRLFII